MERSHLSYDLYYEKTKVKRKSMIYVYIKDPHPFKCYLLNKKKGHSLSAFFFSNSSEKQTIIHLERDFQTAHNVGIMTRLES